MTARTSPRPALAAALVSAALGACLALTGCVAGHDAADHLPAGTAAAAVRDDAQARDIAFAQAMSAHHQQALDMSAMAETRATPRIQALAARIAAAQQPEIARMRDWLTAWGASAADPAHAGHTMPGTAPMTVTTPMSGPTMPGMLGGQALADLAGQRPGASFDRSWLAAMVAHHEGAVIMAQQYLAGGGDPGVRALAETIITDQQREIAEMSVLLHR